MFLQAKDKLEKSFEAYQFHLIEGDSIIDWPDSEKDRILSVFLSFLNEDEFHILADDCVITDRYCDLFIKALNRSASAYHWSVFIDKHKNVAENLYLYFESLLEDVCRDAVSQGN